MGSLELIFEVYGLAGTNFRSLWARDIDLALTVVENEKTLKKTHKTTSRFFSENLETQTGHYRDYLDLVLICRWLDRVGNLATNIAEDVIFETTSADIRHGGELPPELLEGNNKPETSD